MTTSSASGMWAASSFCSVVVNSPSDSMPMTRAGGRRARAAWRAVIWTVGSSGSLSGGRVLEMVGSSEDGAELEGGRVGVEWEKMDGCDKSCVSSFRVMWM